MMRHFHLALVTILALSASVIVGARSANQSAHCLVDLEDVEADQDAGAGHTSRETKYTKLHHGITYTCVSGCDHCCVTETACCDHTKDWNDGKDNGVGAAGCMEDERGNTVESNCGFKMVCCTDDALLPSGDCPADHGVWLAAMVLLVAVCCAAIGICIGVIVCREKKCCCWEPYPKKLATYPAQGAATGYSAPVVVVGQPVMGVAVVEAPTKHCERVVPSHTTQ